MPQRDSSLLDRIAMGLSGLCLVHCVLGFLLVSLFALSGGWLDHRVHILGLALAMPLAAVALWRGFRQHGQAPIGLLGLIGLAAMTESLIVDPGGITEIAVSMAGVSLLATAHWRNLRALRPH